VIFTQENCSFCAKAKDALSDAGYEYSELSVNHKTRSRILGAIAGHKTVPQIFINGTHIGDGEALTAYLKT
jgi:peroxiredoxin